MPEHELWLTALFNDYLAGVATADLAGRRAEAIPDAFAAAVLVGGSFDLVRGGGGAPEEVGREVV